MRNRGEVELELSDAFSIVLRSFLVTLPYVPLVSDPDCLLLGCVYSLVWHVLGRPASILAHLDQIFEPVTNFHFDCHSSSQTCLKDLRSLQSLNWTPRALARTCRPRPKRRVRETKYWPEISQIQPTSDFLALQLRGIKLFTDSISHICFNYSFCRLCCQENEPPCSQQGEKRTSLATAYDILVATAITNGHILT